MMAYWLYAQQKQWPYALAKTMALSHGKNLRAYNRLEGHQIIICLAN